MPSTTEQSDWVERVLGIRPAPAPPTSPQEALKASISSLIRKAEKLTGAPRPNGPPRRQTTEKLLNAMIARPAPDDAEDAPTHVAEFLPDFLVSVETERPTESQKLGVGSSVPGSDQLLGIADLFAAAQRAMIDWETLLDDAEEVDTEIDAIEEQEGPRDETEYTETLTAYNSRRKQTIAAEAKALQLMSELQVAFNSLSESARNAALKEAGTDA